MTDIVLVCDADAFDEPVYYAYPDDLDALADTIDDGDIMEVLCYSKMPMRYLTRDSDGNPVLCETREAAEAIAEAALPDDEDETPGLDVSEGKE